MNILWLCYSGYFDIRCMETQWPTKEPCHWFWHQSRLIQTQVLNVPTSKPVSIKLSWLDYWRAWRYKWSVIYVTGIIVVSGLVDF